MTSENWEEIFPDFVKQISSYTGKEITDTLCPEFATNTPISQVVGQLTIMSAMNHYFKYEYICYSCGFPYITIEGTTNDWITIHNKWSNLAKYEFNWFTTKMIPIIQKIKETTKGNVDKSFWKQMLWIKNWSRLLWSRLHWRLVYLLFSVWLLWRPFNCTDSYWQDIAARNTKDSIRT